MSNTPPWVPHRPVSVSGRKVMAQTATYNVTVCYNSSSFTPRSRYQPSESRETAFRETWRKARTPNCPPARCNGCRALTMTTLYVDLSPTAVTGPSLSGRYATRSPRHRNNASSGPTARQPLTANHRGLSESIRDWSASPVPRGLWLQRPVVRDHRHH